jgi:DNA-binding Lrp family transcriptional regulator
VDKNLRELENISFPLLKNLLPSSNLITGLKPLFQGKRISGYAFPFRVATPSLKPQFKALEVARKKSILIIIAENRKIPVWEYILSEIAKRKGINGVIVDGLVEDVNRIKDLQIYARDFIDSVDPFSSYSDKLKKAFSMQKIDRINISSVEIDNCKIENDDFIVAEGDEIAVVPKWEAENIIDRTKRINETEIEEEKVNVSIDQRDKKILAFLQENSRTTLKEIGRKLGISEATTYYRIKKLFKRGIINGYTIKMDYEKLGLNQVVFILIWAFPEEITEVAQKISEMNVTEVHMISPEQLIAKAILRNKDSLLSLLKEMNKIDKVIRTATLTSLQTFKQELFPKFI